MKKSPLILIIFLFGTISIFAQSESCDCKTDLDFIIEKIKKMPSYKKQIKNEKADLFYETYKKLSTKMQQPVLVENCYRMLLKQMLLVNDVHASLQFSKPYISEKEISNETDLATFRASQLFKNHPKTNRNISELKEELEQKNLEDLEGIYSYNKKERIGFYYADNKKDIIGVVLESDLKQWEIGEIRLYATHTNDNKYNLYYYNVNTRQPGFVKSLSFENGRMWSYKKEGNTLNYEFANNGDKIVDFKQINEDTQYLYFKTFGNSKKRELIKFFNKTKNKINSGGNKKFSDPFLKVLKDKNVYVITNCFAGSNGEQFTLKLLKNKNAIHLGQTTRGIIAYGMNYGNNYSTPSGHFKITPTDMNFNKYITYEGKGITPEISLDFNKDWIEQTLEIIKADKSK
ncbi:S41 family peptidase [Winogradskyella sp.]|uniref:S41 family peptidase n=1 Tax=Winogradskyella sp. TaxID=1883156 RepID=UPI0025F2A4C4|nr:S41 family peptidase [Winogradskyella sp.]